MTGDALTDAFNHVKLVDYGSSGYITYSSAVTRGQEIIGNISYYPLSNECWCTVFNFTFERRSGFAGLEAVAKIANQVVLTM